MELVQTEQISPPQNYLVPDRCFICYGENNLLRDNIHCGTTVYHKTCINDYCNTKETISCPICRKDITDKFTKKNIVVWRPKWNGLSANNEICEKFMMMLALWIPVIIIILSFVVYSFLPNYHTMFIIKGISGYIINLGIIGMAILLLKYTNSGSDCMGILAIILTVFSVLITPLIFLIMSSILSIDTRIVHVFRIIVCRGWHEHHRILRSRCERCRFGILVGADSRSHSNR